MTEITEPRLPNHLRPQWEQTLAELREELAAVNKNIGEMRMRRNVLVRAIFMLEALGGEHESFMQNGPGGGHAPSASND